MRWSSPRPLTGTSAVVRYYADDRYASYRFNRIDGTWQRGDPVSEGTSGWAPVTGSAQAPLGYTKVIAELLDSTGATRDKDWFINNLTAADRGYRSYSEEYQTKLPFSAEFLPGTQTSGDTLFEVQFDGLSKWIGKRLNGRRAGDSIICQHNPCDISFPYDSAGLPWNAGSQLVRVQYYFHVVAPVSVSISGRGAPPNDSIETEGTYTWTATASGGDGSGFSYQWEERPAGGTFSVVGSNSSTYSRFVSSTEAGTTYELRVSATSGGKSASDIFTYRVGTNIEPPVDVSISGPSNIQSGGRYTWYGSASGGAQGSTYSYQWKYCQSSCTVVGTSANYSRTVALGDGDFTLHLTATASLGQQQSGTAAKAVRVQDDQCPECVQRGN